MDANRSEKPRDIRERAFEFAVRIVKLCRHFDKRSVVPRVLSTQLLKSGTSVGANLEEAQGGQSKSDFIAKNSISLKEARETNYWLRIIDQSCDLDSSSKIEVNALIDESRQLSLIIGSIIIKARSR